MLTDDQQLVANETNKNLLVLALPGSGKTHTSIQQAVNILNESENNWLIMVTFTRASTNETQHRLAEAVSGDAMKRVRVDTFAKLMKDHAKPLINGRKVVMGPQHEMLVRRAISNFPKEDRGTAGRYIREKLHGELLRLNGDVQALETPGQVYMDILEKANKVDLATLNTMLVIKLHSGEIQPFGATHMIVDEFQDTDLTQLEWILSHQRNGTLVTAVGDDDQSIYSWRGARSVENMTRFQQECEADGVLLRRCFRCRPEILKVAEQLIEFNEERIEKEMVSARESGGKVEFLPVTQGDCYDADNFDPDELREQFIQVCEFAPTLDKFKGRRRRVLEIAYQELIDKREKFGKKAANPKTMNLYTNTYGYIAASLAKNPNGWAVLARTNKALDQLQAELAARDIAVTRIGGQSVWDNPNIMGYVSVLAVLANDKKVDDLDNALFFLGERSDTIHEVHSLARQNKGMSKVPSASIQHPLKEGTQLLIDFLEDDRCNKSSQVDGYIKELTNKMIRLSKEMKEKEYVFHLVNGIIEGFSGTLAERVERLLKVANKRDKQIDIRKPNTVVLSTLTGSKGLQWKNVWLMDVERNVLPIKAREQLSEAAELARIEEERRLAFVAATRAEDLLRVSWADGKESYFVEEMRGY